MKKYFLVSAWIIALFLPSSIVFAESPSFSIRQAVVWVHCGNRQGSGVVIHADPGYVLTNAHILMSLNTMQPDTCEIAFINETTLQPEIYYTASYDRYVYDDSRNQDFAILKIGSPKNQKTVSPFPAIKTDEFSKVNDPLSIMSFPSKTKGVQLITSGTIQDLDQGIIKTNAEISPGSSGGAGLDANNNLVGIAARILYREISPGVEELVDYELVDIRDIIIWLDTFGTNMHDNYFTHANAVRFHGPAAFFTPENLSCSSLVKTSLSTTIYCLKPDATRRAFPNNATYHSWLPDFTGVGTISLEELSTYRLISMVTVKPGTLVKIQTDPKVYIVSDTAGTLRWLKTEDLARELYGDGWAGFVKDIPVEFFANYHLGTAVE